MTILKFKIDELKRLIHVDKVLLGIESLYQLSNTTIISKILKHAAETIICNHVFSYDISHIWPVGLKSFTHSIHLSVVAYVYDWPHRRNHSTLLQGALYKTMNPCKISPDGCIRYHPSGSTVHWLFPNRTKQSVISSVPTSYPKTYHAHVIFF